MKDNTLREKIRTELTRAMMTAPNRMTEANINDEWVSYWEVHNAEQLIEPILALLAKEVRKAQLDELLILNHYFERANDSILAESYVTDRIKQLEKEGK